MMKPLKQFICDGCGEVIDDPKEGYIQWLVKYTGSDRSYRGFKIVHQAAFSPSAPRKDCYFYKGDVGLNDVSLATMLLPEGMGQLLSFLDEGPYFQAEYRGPYVEDMREFVEFVRRLTIPYFEEARLYWSAALSDNYFDGQNPSGLYLPDILEGVVKKYGKK